MATNHSASYEEIVKLLDEFKKKDFVIASDAKADLNNRNKDFKFFTAMCMKEFLFPYDADTSQEFNNKIWHNIVDGANDCGIDFVCVYDSVTDDGKPCKRLAIGQSKYREKTDIDDTLEALTKLIEGYRDYHGNENNPNDLVDQAFRNARAELDYMDPESYDFWLFWASGKPMNEDFEKRLDKRWKANKPTASKDKKEDFQKHIKFGEDIVNTIRINENSGKMVANGTIKVDNVRNILAFPYGNPDAIIVNVSASSLSDLYETHRDLLLSQNLRFFVKAKSVDDPIDQTIQNEHNKFWYRNNGITIVCEGFDTDPVKNEIKLHGFSIINGGQTTYRIHENRNIIGTEDNKKNFFLPCKIIRIRGQDERERQDFVDDIAESTNTQKAIKNQDSYANSIEQRDIQEACRSIGVFYRRKRGEKNSNLPWATSLEDAGKLLLAGVLQMPGSARNNSSKLYEKSVYKKLYFPDNPEHPEERDNNKKKRNQVAKLIKDFVWIDEFYKEQQKKAKPTKKSEKGTEAQENVSDTIFGFDLSKSSQTITDIINNGKTIIIAITGLCSRIAQGFLIQDDFIDPTDDNRINPSFQENMGELSEWSYVLKGLWASDGDNNLEKIEEKFESFIHEIIIKIDHDIKIYRKENPENSPLVTNIFKADVISNGSKKDSDSGPSFYADLLIANSSWISDIATTSFKTLFTDR